MNLLLLTLLIGMGGGVIFAVIFDYFFPVRDIDIEKDKE